MSFAAAKRTGIPARLRALVHENRGVAALEFAALLPLFIILYLGTFEVGQGISIKLNNALAARTVADLASQYSNIANADMTAILGASSTVMAPYPTQPFSVTVSEVTVDALATTFERNMPPEWPGRCGSLASPWTTATASPISDLKPFVMEGE